MFSEINHSQPDDCLEIPTSMNSNDGCADQQSSAGDVPANQETLTVIKIGGSTFGNHDTTLRDLVELQKKGEKFVVVHGGGKTISEWMEKQGVRPKFVNGLRVTDSQSLDIVVAVLTGVINKSLVASINASAPEIPIALPPNAFIEATRDLFITPVRTATTISRLCESVTLNPLTNLGLTPCFSIHSDIVLPPP
jgi:hypothetical protein